MEFILSDESVNSYGFKVLTSGIDLSDFKKNPVGFYNHNRQSLPILKWKDVKRGEGNKLMGTPEFDMSDEFAVQVKNKVDGGFLNATSAGLAVLETSNRPELMSLGQKYPTVTKSKLIECSIVDIPSNKNAIRLFAQNAKGEYIELNQDNVEEIEANLKALLEPQEPTFDMTKEELKELFDNAVKPLNEKIEELQGKVEELSKKEIKTLSAEDIIEQMKKAKEEAPKTSVKDTLLASGKSFKELFDTNDKNLALLKAEDPEAYKAFKDSYNQPFTV